MPTSIGNMLTATNVKFIGREMVVTLGDGRTARVPFGKYPILRAASPRQRNDWELAAYGTALRWEEIDEDISVDGILRAPETEVSRPRRKRSSRRTSRARPSP